MGGVGVGVGVGLESLRPRSMKKRAWVRASGIALAAGSNAVSRMVQAGISASSSWRQHRRPALKAIRRGEDSNRRKLTRGWAPARTRTSAARPRSRHRNLIQALSGRTWCRHDRPRGYGPGAAPVIASLATESAR